MSAPRLLIVTRSGSRHVSTESDTGPSLSDAEKRLRSVTELSNERSKKERKKEREHIRAQRMRQQAVAWRVCLYFCRDACACLRVLWLLLWPHQSGSHWQLTSQLAHVRSQMHVPRSVSPGMLSAGCTTGTTDQSMS